MCDIMKLKLTLPRITSIIFNIIFIISKIPYVVWLNILVATFLIIDALRLLYGMKNEFSLLGFQVIIFIVILFGPRFLISLFIKIVHSVMTRLFPPDCSNNSKKYCITVAIFTTIIITLLLLLSLVLVTLAVSRYLNLVISSLCNNYSFTISVIIVFIYIKFIITMILRLLSLKQLIKSIIVSAILILIMIGTTYVIFRSSIYGLHSLEEISDYVNTRTYYSQALPIRGGNDIFMWSLFGVGACGEMAYIAKVILESKGYEAYVAGFPGEDHVFTVVYINGSWWVLDPGYPCCRSVSMVERVKYRIQEMGNVSSVIVYLDAGFIDLTEYYVPYDTFIFNVTYRGHPVAGACITLRHLFDNKFDIEIPGKGMCYYTNSSGIAVIYLGGSGYNGTKIRQSDPYFEVCVNGKSVGIHIQSSASSKTHIINIDLSKPVKDN